MGDRKSWHSLPPKAVAAEFAVDVANGLDEAEASARRERYGPNSLPEPKEKSLFQQFFGQFLDPLVGALLVAAVVAAAVAATGGEDGSWADAVAILLIVVLNAVLGFMQERRAAQALAALRGMAAPRAKVRRGGEVHEIDAADLVPGDLIELHAGDAIPADARLLRAADLSVEEAALTGESVPVEKTEEPAEDEAAPLADRHSMVFTGTTTTRGRATAVVVATGVDTELGRIGTMISEAGRTPTPLEQRLARLGNVILVACILISALVFTIGFVRETHGVPMLLLIAVSLAVAAIPEGLPAITTITLALGMQRMARRGAIVRKLPAVETLGSATIICSDKTGTLTQNEMTVRVLRTPAATYEVSGEGYQSEGAIARDGKTVGSPDADLRRLLMAAALCNNTHFEEEEGERRVVGDPTEAALQVAAEKADLARARLLTDHEILRELPFDSDRKRMSVVVREADGTSTAFVKGSPGGVLGICTRLRRGDDVVPLDDAERERLLAENEGLAGRAFRVLALAERDVSADGADSDPERELVFLGFAAMIDPPRPDAKAAVAACHRAGILVTMITGDHRETAVAIARELGIWSDEAVALSGAELREMDDDALAEVAPRTRVFARVTAEQKLRIVRALERGGHVVSMTGDGVNDAPALKEAAIGVAMGRSGTDVARQSADMVLADDRFATIVEAVREGRAIFADIQKFIFFLGSSNAGLVFVVVVLSFFDELTGLTPLQLLWINLVTNGLPALALGVDPPEPGQMKRGPRPPAQGIVGMRDLWGLILVGGIMCVGALAFYGLAAARPELFTGQTVAERYSEARTMAFLLLAFSPLFHAFNCRSPTESIFSVGWFSNHFLWAALGISATLQVLTILTPGLRTLFATEALTLTQWGLVLGLSVLPLPIVEAMKAADRARTRARRAG